MKKADKTKSLTWLFLLLSFGMAKFAGAKPATETHDEPIATETTYTPKSDDDRAIQFDSVAESKPVVKFSEPDKSLYTELEVFSFATPGNAKLVWSPLVIIKPTITFNDKFTLGFTTTQMIQNYTTESMTPIMHDMYAHADLKLKNNTAFIKAGHFSALNYAGEFAPYMTNSYFFENAINMHSGHYLPSGVVGGVSNDKFAVAGGYAEYDKQFKFSGGDFIAVGEIFLNKVKIGTLWMINKDKCVGDLQVVYNPNQKNSVLLELVNIGNNEFGVHAIYAFNITDAAKAFVNGYAQFNGGIAGGYIGAKHTPTGIYLSGGVTHHNNLLRGTDQYDKPTPMVELGIKKDFPGLFNLITRNKTNGR